MFDWYKNEIFISLYFQGITPLVIIVYLLDFTLLNIAITYNLDIKNKYVENSKEISTIIRESLKAILFLGLLSSSKSHNYILTTIGAVVPWSLAVMTLIYSYICIIIKRF